MSVHRTRRRQIPGLGARALLAAALGVLALPAAAAQGSLLQITLGPHETDWLQAKELKVLLDGAPLAVALPAAGADPTVPIYSDVVKPGAHRIEVEAGFTGSSTAFSYVEGYVFRMSGQADVEVPPGQAIGVQVKVIKKSGLTVQWTDRFQLALQASRYPSESAASAQLPDDAVPAAAPAVVAVAMRAEPAPEPERAPAQRAAGACTLEPIRFAFGKYKLEAAARGSLDRFAACLQASGESARIEGYADAQGPADYNDWLSGQRADEAADYLVRRGVDRARLTTRAHGATNLVCSHPTESCRARNRRTEAVTTRP